LKRIASGVVKDSTIFFRTENVVAGRTVARFQSVAMNATDPAPLPPMMSGDEPTAPTTSVFAKMSNIFVEPGEVFDEVRRSKHNYLNWLVPMLISLGVAIVFVWVVFSQDAVMQQMRAAQDKQFEAQVTAGKMTRQQADQAMQMTQKFMSPLVLKAFGSVGAAIGSVGWLFGFSLLFWLVGKYALKGQFGYLKAVEVVSLAGMITVLGTVATMLIVVATGNMAMNPGPVLLVVRDYDAANKLHRILSALNLPMLWYLAVMATGLSRLTGKSWILGAVWTFVPYAVIFGALILLGIGG
jgi:hypothetical protein